ncbi:MAG TPA: 16S rRNA (cytidine(1402)-2'-O)-methyltransferase [Longimicrobiaceae bacterium]|jgi:16S rRNA (cytidine1402-2'-O)-methyltransferase|nr:16S rRNA (cytidine(1402)-2'-O)-methyltransferase [Longimicrobiaceae bacterium]
MPSLYLVSTPIGNLGDITYRAVDVLRSADVILAEDTRRTAVLLRHYGIESRLVSAHEHNEAARARLLVEMLGEGKSVALVSDAGTPLLSDPGARLVSAAVEAGYPVVPVPGPSALLAALVASGLSADRFTFYGFIPRKGGDRATLLAEIAASPYTSVLYESPQRTAELLADLRGAAGADRRVVIARELTKLHEEFYRAPLGEAVEHFAERQPRGEIVLVVEGNPAPPAPADEAQATARTLTEALLAQGAAPSAVAKELRQRLGIARNEAYQLVQEIAGGG